MSREESEHSDPRSGTAAREATRASAALDEAVVAFMGVNATDGRACDVLDQYGQMTAGELAEHLGLYYGRRDHPDRPLGACGHGGKGKRHH